ncbi:MULTISPECIES: D-ribose pyranase [Stappiaceae]|jgi:D-ribose pyranase|uniref:D-ribose pyranase n=1 Tax=Stappiaceae TaxID=2821832 RepID=UPI000782B1E6|nr:MULTISPECIES: D-ribose pyranase [Stappiaceae]MCR9281362.1 D-ribose pyranase [Paracoccaceae bacterium]MEE2863825.1 D-ribose pyranase [Pseudomonadota bacterium]AMN51993.1 ribose pyranase [Labrenzia sp. CP4]MBO6859075.1 D-ribose pyranase [Roseibium sp.]MBO9460424.1 D-ribose pyranase [Labrenzia sp. R5_0]
MKRTKLLNRHLSKLVASLGHMDEIVLADAGLPVPANVGVIDLAVSPGIPAFFDVLEALADEMIVEQAVFADEASEDLVTQIEVRLAHWAADTGKPIEHVRMSHEDFKERCSKARAVIRTGECTPYANLILVSGVPF